MHGDVAVRNFSTKRKATMANRRLTIFATALILVTGCSAESTVSPEIQDFVGSWSVLTEVWTSVADPTTSQDNLLLPQEASESYMVFYDDHDVLLVTHYVDTTATVGGAPLGVESFFDVLEWCVDVAPHKKHDDIGHNHERECEAAGPTDLIIDEFAQPTSTNLGEIVLQFTRSGENMTLTGLAQANLEYEFDPLVGDEPATLVITLESVILDIERPDVVRCVTAC